MGKLLLDNIAGIAGETIKLLILIVTGVVLLDRVKNATRELKMRVAALEHWRDEHISSIQPHTVCILEDRRKIDEREPQRPGRPQRSLSISPSEEVRKHSASSSLVQNYNASSG